MSPERVPERNLAAAVQAVLDAAKGGADALKAHLETLAQTKFCIPIIVDEERAFHVNERPFPGLVAGKNAWGEPQATWRDVRCSRESR